MAKEEPPQDVRRAVAKLLKATMEFTRAYEAWTHAPRAWEPIRRQELDRAEVELEEAEHEVALKQSHADTAIAWPGPSKGAPAASGARANDAGIQGAPGEE